MLGDIKKIDGKYFECIGTHSKWRQEVKQYYIENTYEEIDTKFPSVYIERIIQKSNHLNKIGD